MRYGSAPGAATHAAATQARAAPKGRVAFVAATNVIIYRGLVRPNNRRAR
jgi:hypothetical protein